MELAEANLLRLMDAVGAENVYVEIMDHGIGAETAVLKPLAALADRHCLTMVATNDAHFVHDDDCETHEVWLAAQSKATLDDPKRFKFNGTGYHLRTEDEMRDLRPGVAALAGRLHRHRRGRRPGRGLGAAGVPFPDAAFRPARRVRRLRVLPAPPGPAGCCPAVRVPAARGGQAAAAARERRDQLVGVRGVFPHPS